MSNDVQLRWTCPNCSTEFAQAAITLESTRVWKCPVDQVTVEWPPSRDGMPPGWCTAEGDYFDKASCAATYIAEMITSRQG